MDRMCPNSYIYNMVTKKRIKTKASLQERLSSRLSDLSKAIHQQPLQSLLTDIDKLVVDCEKAGKPRLHVQSLLLHSTALRRLGRTKDALAYAEKALKTAGENDLSYEKIDAAKKCTFLYHQLFDFEKAESMAATNLVDARKHGFKDLEADALAMVGHVFEIKDEFDKAVVYFEEARKCARNAKHYTREITVLSDLGRIFGILGNFLLSLEYLERALEMARSKKTPAYVPTIMFRMGDVYRSVDDFDKAEQLYSESLARAENLEIFTEVIESKGRLGRLRLQERNYEEALDIFMDIDKIAKDLDYRRHNRFNQIAIAETYVGKKWFGEAKETLWKVLIKVKSQPEANHVLIQQALEQLGIVYSNLGAKREATRLSDFSRRWRDSGKPGIYTSHQQILLRAKIHTELGQLISDLKDAGLKEFSIRGRHVKFRQNVARVSFDDCADVTELTPNETKLLRCLIKYQGSDVEVGTLAEELVEGARNDPQKDWRLTVKVPIHHLRKKLHDEDHSIIETVRNVGWRLAEY